MQTLEIDIPKGHEVESFDFNKSKAVIKFKETPKDIKERIKTFMDVLEHLNIDEDDFVERIEDMTEDEAAYVKIKLIVRTLNEGWVPDWSNSSQYKYYPWFHMGSSSGVGFSFLVDDRWVTHSNCGSRLCFISREAAIYAGEQFESLYKEYFVME